MARFEIYRRLARYLRPYWPQVVMAYAAMLFATLLNLIIPQVLRRAIDQGLEQSNPTALFAAAGADPGYCAGAWGGRFCPALLWRVALLPRGL